MEFKPVNKESRIEAVDAIRGFALLGILLANIPFNMVNAVGSDKDSFLVFIYYLLVDKKFITIFSILFGFGFHMQLKRAGEAGIRFKGYFTVRMLLLFAIGTLHAFIISNGDILRAYAAGGILMLLIRNWPLKRLLVTAFLFTVIFTGIIYIGNNAFGWQVYNYDYALATELIYTPSYTRYLVINAILDPWVNFLKDMPVTLVYTFGNMIIGFILGREGFFTQAGKMEKLTNSFILFGSVISLACSYIYYKVSTGEIELTMQLAWLPFVLITGIVLQGLIYISIITRLFNLASARRLLRFFEFTGRTALSNYVLQSLFFLIIFYHCTHTFSLSGRLSLTGTWLTAISFFTLQSLLSYLWLRKYKQGPLEYGWRKISYRMASRLNTNNK